MGTAAAQLGIVFALVIAVCWIVYGITDPLETAVLHEKFYDGDFQQKAKRLLGGDGFLYEAFRLVIADTPFPRFMRDIAMGVKLLSLHNAKGHWGYLFGEVSYNGWWYYYPVVLAVKTPLTFLGLAIAGGAFTVYRGIAVRDWRILAPILCGGAILVVMCAFSRVNSGVRHILILYPLLAIAIGGLVGQAWQRRNRTLVAIAGATLLWQGAQSAATHPDYLADFNLLVGRNPDRILVDSDLDWGQDLKRLGQEIERRKIGHIRVLYYGTADITRHVPNAVALDPSQPATGWIAVSATIGATAGPDLDWLRAHEPVARIGRSIDLYYIAR